MMSTDRNATAHLQPTDRLLPWLLCASATPSIAALLSTQSLLKWLEDLGVASEEIFRGDRLPVLHFPTETEDRQ
jgi:hypothetical protein